MDEGLAVTEVASAMMVDGEGAEEGREAKDERSEKSEIVAICCSVCTADLSSHHCISAHGVLGVALCTPCLCAVEEQCAVEDDDEADDSLCVWCAGRTGCETLVLCDHCPRAWCSSWRLSFRHQNTTCRKTARASGNKHTFEK